MTDSRYGVINGQAILSEMHVFHIVLMIKANIVDKMKPSTYL